jgi:hypothetical protein
MTSGGGFETGSDYVAAKVSIDVDGSGISSLREMSQEIDRVRTSTEAAARSGASFVGYIQQVTQAAKQATEAHRDLSAQLERTAEMQSRGAAMGGGGGSSQALTSSRLAPGGYVDPWAGMGAGMGGSRSPSPSDVQAQIDPTRQLDPRKYLNAQAGRYNLQPGDLPSSPGQADWGSHANRVAERDRAVGDQQRATSPAQASGGGRSGDSGEGAGNTLGNYGGYGRLASNIANEMRPGGGSWSGVAKALHGGMRGLNKHLSASAKGTGTATADAAAAGGAESAEGMGIGALGGAAGVAGLGLAGLAAVEKGGAMYQGYKNMGMIRGQGAGTGIADEAAIRTMALNPFITTEQSRQIIMAGLTEGYSGKQFDSVTNFMADNLKNMNISVSDSVGMLRKNVNEGGQSIAGLAASLGVLKGMSQNGAMSLPDMVNAFQQTSGDLVSQGVSGGAASMDAINAVGAFSGDMTMKGTFAQMVGSAGSTDQSAAMMRAFGGGQGLQGVIPSMEGTYLSQTGQSQSAINSTEVTTIIKNLMGNTPRNSKAFLSKVPVVMRMLARAFPGTAVGTDKTLAMKWINAILDGRDPNAEGVAARQQVSSQVNSANPTGFLGAEGTAAEDQGQVGMDLVTGSAKWLTATFSNNSEAQANAFSSLGKDVDTEGYDMNAESSNPVMNNVIDHLGAGNIEVMNGGKAGPLTGSQQQMRDLAAGKLKWRQKGSQGDGMTLDQTPSQGSVTSSDGGGATNVTFSPAQVQINVKSDGSASASPNPLTLNATAVNAGQGTATANNPEANIGYDKGSSIF